MKESKMSKFVVDENIALDDEEKRLLAGLEGAQSNFSERKVRELSQIAKEQRNRNKSVSMRLSDDDYLRAKARSMEEGIPYQVLLASIIHKWLRGRLVEA